MGVRGFILYGEKAGVSWEYGRFCRYINCGSISPGIWSGVFFSDPPPYFSTDTNRRNTSDVEIAVRSLRSLGGRNKHMPTFSIRGIDRIIVRGQVGGQF